MTAVKPRIHSLFIHPLKGAKPISIQSMDIEETGPRWDREWMLIDEKNDFLSQRKKAKLCLIEQQINKESLLLSAPGMESITIPVDKYPTSELEVTIFGKKIRGIHVDKNLDQWFSDYFGEAVRLVRSPQENRRLISKNHFKKDQTIHFADGYPFLLTSLSTLDDLNSRLKDPVTMNRFRPNIVIENAPANDEDNWSSYSIGDINFLSVKACARCVVVTVDQDSGKKSGEPLKTLASYRMKDGNILFGQNLVHLNFGKISIGQELQNIK